MQQDSTQQTNLSQPDQQIQLLEQQLNEAIAGENFYETASGRLSAQLATAEIDKLVKDICSDKYLEDHRGYVIAVLALEARRNWLKRIQVAGSKTRINKLREKLAEDGQL